jgi:hypothetical protein
LDKESTDVGLKILWAFGVAALAGFISYVQRFLQEPPPPWSWKIAGVKVSTAGFVGLLTGWLLSGWNVPENYVYFAMGVAGYGGGETIVFFQQVFKDTISRYASKS